MSPTIPLAQLQTTRHKEITIEASRNLYSHLEHPQKSGWL